MQLEATVASNVQEMKVLTLAKQKLEAAVAVSDEELGDIRLSQAELSNHNTTLIEELERVRLSHVEMCKNNKHVEAEKAALAAQCKKLTVKNAGLENSLQQSSNMTARLNSHCDELSVEAIALKKENAELVSANALLKRSDAIARTENRNRVVAATLREKEAVVQRWKEVTADNAGLQRLVSDARHERDKYSRSIKELTADAIKKDTDLSQTKETVRRLTHERKKWKAQNHRLAEELEAAKGTVLSPYLWVLLTLLQASAMVAYLILDLSGGRGS